MRRPSKQAPRFIVKARSLRLPSSSYGNAQATTYQTIGEATSLDGAKQIVYHAANIGFEYVIERWQGASRSVVFHP